MMCKLPIPYKLQICGIVAAVFAVLAGALSDHHAAHAQGSDNDYVDVAVILEAPDDTGTASHLDLGIVVVNHGARTAYDVEVVVDLVYPEASSYFESFGLEVPVGSVSLENSKYRLRWSIPALGGLQREEVPVEARIRQTSSPAIDKRHYTHEFVGEVTTSSFESNLHKGNNTSRVWSVPYLASDGHRAAYGNYAVAVTVDKPSLHRGTPSISPSPQTMIKGLSHPLT